MVGSNSTYDVINSVVGILMCLVPVGFLLLFAFLYSDHLEQRKKLGTNTKRVEWDGYEEPMWIIDDWSDHG